MQNSRIRSEENFRLLIDSVKDYAIFMLDPEGHVISWSAGAQNIKGYEAGEVIGQHFSRFYPQEAIERGWPELELSEARLRGRFEDEGWRIRKDGSRFWANVIITALHDTSGTLVGFAKITRDLTERRSHEEELERSEESLRLLIEGVKDYAIFMLDPQGYVASWNNGAERIKGYAPSEILGKHFSCFYPVEDQMLGKPRLALAKAREEGSVMGEGWRVRKDGSQFWADTTITALYDKNHRLRGFAKLTRDLTERKRTEELEESGRRTQEFLAMLAHELRNPLAALRSAAGVIRMKGLQDRDLIQSQEIIDRQLTHLTHLVDDLLDIGRLTSGRILLRKEPVDIQVIVGRAVEASRPLIDSKRHSLNVNVPREPIYVRGDATRLSQALINLLNNAAKYTPGSGRIDVTVTKSDKEMSLSVRDTGIGISAELLPRVFDLFTQGQRTLDRSEGGLGIGLTLVRQVVTMHGGTIDGRSDGIGRGSEFIIHLPLMLESEARREAARQHALPTTPSLKSRRVLVVDDNRDSAESLSMLLRLWGHDVIGVHDGYEALKAAGEFKPEIILLDVGLPGMDGYETAKRLRHGPEGASVALVAVTGYGQAEDRRRSREAGFDHHLIKPVDPETLRTLIASISQ